MFTIEFYNLDRPQNFDLWYWDYLDKGLSSLHDEKSTCKNHEP